MGRLAAQWAGLTIKDRFPYDMTSELTLIAGQIPTQFASSAFLQSIDKPFEVHRMIPRVIANDSAGVPLPDQPDQDLLMSLLFLDGLNQDINQKLFLNASRIIAIVKGSSERTWEWAEPQVLKKSGQYVMSATPLAAFPTISGLVSLTLVLTFQGFLLQVAPPSDVR